MKVGIVTDNTCNLPIDYLEKNDIGYTSLYILRESRHIKAVDLCPTTFYEELKVGSYVPLTSQPSVKDFEEVYRAMLQRYDYLITLTISEKLSGTLNSARLAASMVDEKRIFAIDSKLTSFGLGFLVLELKDKIESGKYSIEQLIEYSINFHTTIRTIFSVTNLDYLYKGGRIGKAKALMGGLLNMKPILSLIDGEIIPVKSVRGINKMIKEVVNHAMDRIDSLRLKKIAVIHTSNLKYGGLIIEELRERGKNDDDIIYSLLDPVIGTHLGPDAVGVITQWE
ncbi:EDD domain protein, DegV family [Marinitoga hydrogenitolerans DSM 16785]|uniref:EDD domain protein, DegV family n=1 Tax=Marinitoga hydrogenitolerans (strain DSM 16785 / JCM 12826 / AT1271) TaxID=1122195 RepID=A0A1M4S5J1_MARH1|nr:DegV family protein [Marinitoga hydrogenitolerans]SHE27440.1 EDD domain protein, DegV family [Marinitoga hydrogenitolerans DSM 16785]